MREPSRIAGNAEGAERGHEEVRTAQRHQGPLCNPTFPPEIYPDYSMKSREDGDVSICAIYFPCSPACLVR